MRTRPKFALEVERGRGGRYTKVRDFTELVDQFLGHTVGEGLLVHLVGQVEKRQHGNGFLWRRGNFGRGWVIFVFCFGLVQGTNYKRAADGTPGRARAPSTVAARRVFP